MMFRRALKAFSIASLSLAAACAPSIAPMVPRPATPVHHPDPDMPNVEAPRLPSREPSVAVPDLPAGEVNIRVALALNDSRIEVGGIEGNWGLFGEDGTSMFVTGSFSDVVSITSKSGSLNVTAFGKSVIVGSVVYLRPLDRGVLFYGGKRYRGEFVISVAEGGRVNLINRLSMEEYLRGVVPLEIGQDRKPEEIAAVAAQAIAARSYAHTMMAGHPLYDVSATVMHQAYGGRDAERPLSDSAISMTRGLVLFYGGKVAMTPYHSNSGGITASANEIWKTDGMPYLVSVSDKIPGTDRYYSEPSPRFKWSRTYSGGGLVEVLNKTLAQYVGGVGGKISRVEGIREGGRSASGRLTSVVIDTDRGNYTVKGADIRFVFRNSTGAILPSTLFSIKVEKAAGKVSRVLLNGFGNGHGVGMDQWGAIYRARAGQDFITILYAYYPGTTIGTAL